MTSIPRNNAPTQPNRQHGLTINGDPITRQQAFTVKSILATGDRLHVSDDVKLAAVSAAIVESSLDSSTSSHGAVGLFGQREVWGSKASRTNVNASTEKFMVKAQNYADAHKGAAANVIAQHVQASAFPDPYAGAKGEATAVIAAASSAELIGRIPTRQNLGG